VSETVLDASALLALLQAEPGAERVAAALPRAALSSVNLSEVVAKLADGGLPIEAIRASLGALDLDVRSFDEDSAYEAGGLRPATRAHGLSLADRACLALARRLGATALTADRAWIDLEVGVAVEAIR
jgi:ribonuclease VapC